jgi:hypothetical protein
MTSTHTTRLLEFLKGQNAAVDLDSTRQSRFLARCSTMRLLQKQYATPSEPIYRNSYKDIERRSREKRNSGLEPTCSGSETVSEAQRYPDHGSGHPSM